MKITKSFSKLFFFLFHLSVFLFLPACSKDEMNVVPETLVNFTININNYPLGLTQSIVLTNTMVGTPNLGYDNNGIIIFRNSQSEFFAYDRTCTYHVEESYAVNIGSSSLFAVCPACSSLFQLSFSGFPSDESLATYPLKQYRATFYPNTMDLYVTNY
jgi:hypothetical protein